MKMSQSFGSHLLSRIFPPLLIMVMLITWLGYDQHRRHQMEMESQRLHAEAYQIFQSTAFRFEDLSRQAAYLAKNDFVIGSLIDVRLRNQVLPSFFQSLTVHGLPFGMTGTVGLLDYKGRIIASNRPMVDLPAVGTWINDAHQGTEVRQIDDTGLILYRVITFYSPDSREAAVIIQLNPEELIALLDLAHASNRVSITTGYGGHTIESPKDELPPGHRLIQGRMQGDPESWVQEVVVSADEKQALLSARYSFLVNLGVLVAMLILLTILILFFVKKAVQPLEYMADALGQIVGHNDLTKRLRIRGPVEIEHLSTHINEMLDRIGESTRSVEELNAVTQSQRILLDTIPIQVWYLTSSETYGQVNKAHADFTGIKPEKLAHKNIYDLLPEEVADVCREGNVAVFKATDPINIEEWVPCSTGENRLLSITKTPRLYRDGTVEFVVCSAVDITEQRQMEFDLKAERTRLSAIITGTHVGTWEWNVQTGETIFNERWAEIIGYTLEELGSVSIETWQKFAHPEDLKQSQTQLEKHFKGEIDYYQTESRMKHKGGYWVWLLDRGRIFSWTDDGKPLMMFGTHMEITDRKTAEDSLKKAKVEADSANLAKSTFLANMSHEIRTPLNAILGFGEILGRDASLLPDQAQKVATINRSGRHLLKLINNILDISKIESGRVTLEMAEFSLINLWDDLDNMFRFQLENKGLHWEMEKHGQIPLFIVGDEARLRQVLINLVGNAVKYTESGKITVRVKMEKEKGNPNRFCLKVEVEDTGPGIAKADLAHIFEAFQQCKTTCQAGGTGLGLAISRRLVELMDGRITVESRQGSGSSFQIFIPVKIAAGDMKIKKDRSQVPVGLAPGTELKRILVVDDLKPNRDLLTAMLARPGFEIRTAQSGEHALKIVAAWSPHAVFMDIRMPIMDGYETIRRLKADETTAGIPIIATTADVFDRDVKKMFDVGAESFIGKPFTPTQLFDVLGKALNLTYVYADKTGKGTGATDAGVVKKEPITLTKTDMARLPEALLQAIQDAVEIGDIQKMKKLSPEIQQIDAGVAEKIHFLLKRYDYEAIIRAIQR